ncbi:MAG: hypothetical protein WC683_13080 [bacterium]
MTEQGFRWWQDGPNAAADELRALMSQISEDECCAGWLMGLEFNLWRWMMRAGCHDETAYRLAVLAHEAGGCWIWYESIGCVFMPVGQWQAEYAAFTGDRL